MHSAKDDRYAQMAYVHSGDSGLQLPKLSLGLWHNFGDKGDYETMKAMIFTAFDQGITHFDLANNYGPPPGSAESNFGRILKEALLPYRDELIISTKAGYTMWEGPYGDWGSRKYLIASLDRVYSSAQIYEAVWAEPAFDPGRTVAVHVRHIREKIEADPRNPRYLKVVYGLGYKVVSLP